MNYQHDCTKDELSQFSDPVWTDAEDREYDCFCEMETSHLINTINYLKGNEDQEDLGAEMMEDLKRRQQSPNQM